MDRFGAGIQKQARNEIIQDLQRICSNVEAAYSGVIARLLPVKQSFDDPAALVTELRAFAADNVTRDSFKPDHLCSEVDVLLSKLANNLDPLKYSVDVPKIRSLQQNISMIVNMDAMIYNEYDEFARSLGYLATDLKTLRDDDLRERQTYTRHVIQECEEDLFSAAA